MLGVCVDGHNPAGRPSPSCLAGFTWLRQVAFDDALVASYCGWLKRAGFQLGMVLANESFGGEPTTAGVQRLAKRYHPDCWIIGNEMDAGALAAESPASWSLPPASYADLWAMCADVLIAEQPGVPLGLGGLVSGQPSIGADYLAAVEGRGYVVSAVDVHPYGKDAAAAEQLLLGYRSAFLDRVPLMVLEWSQEAAAMDAYVAMLGRQTVASCYFCWSDGMVDGFGLMDAQGAPKAEYSALLATAAPPAAPGQMDAATLAERFRAWLADPTPNPLGHGTLGELHTALTGGLWDPSHGLDPAMSPYHILRYDDGRPWGRIECTYALVESNDRYEFWILEDARSLARQMAALRGAGGRF